jgi:hypothetical protein
MVFRSSKVAATVVILLFISVALSSVQAQEWDINTSKDEMTGEISVYATSARTAPNESMDFPYSDVEAWLGFGCDAESEWAYVGFNEKPNLPDAQAQSGGYSTITTRIRWDDDIENMRMSQEFGDRFLHFQSDGKAISNMIKSNEALLELEWYRAGNVYFRFSLSGSAQAIESARQRCQK